jgi:spermidine/putrescine transport system ATP-binding protein
VIAAENAARFQRLEAPVTPGAVLLQHVTKTFDEILAVDDLTLEIPSGSFFALLGPSGCGKTTTLRMIGGFEEPDGGTIEVGGKSVTGVPPYKREVNTVFQSYALFPHLNVFENVAFGLRRKKVPKAQLEGRVREILRIVGLEGFDERKPSQLSGGQQQRVALARALVNSPKVLLLDEPLGALDLKLRKQMQLELKRIQSELGLTFVHVTHDQEEAMTMADAIAVMHRGRLEQLGSPTELYEHPRTGFVAGFLGVSNLLDGTVTTAGSVRVDGAGELRVDADLPTAGTRVRIGVRPEQLRLGTSGVNAIEGTVTERAYIGVATQYVVDTFAGMLTVFVQSSGAAVEGDNVTVSWDPDSTFVVEEATT